MKYIPLISKQRNACIFLLKSRVNCAVLKYIFHLKRFAVKVIFNSVLLFIFPLFLGVKMKVTEITSCRTFSDPIDFHLVFTIYEKFYL